MKLTLIASALLLILLGLWSEADVIALDHINRGAFSEQSDGVITNYGCNPTAYNVGQFEQPIPNNTILEWRNYFTFDLSSVSDPIVNAELRLYLAPGGFNSGDPDETIAFFHVETPINVITGSMGSAAIFADLGSGASYGSCQISEGDEANYVTLSLNSSFLNDANAANGILAVGGAVTSIATTGAFGYEYVFQGSGAGDPAAQLILTTIPEPSSLALMLLSYAVTGLFLRKHDQ